MNKKTKRPWGYYTLLVKTSEYLIKKIVISPKQSISLQKHNHRSEHWIVLSGKANIQIGTKKIILKKSQSVFVPEKRKHKIMNKSSEPLVILETQLGKILSEDDIIRYDVDYIK
ncbi:MAG: phosphomannose isomerase type II C-terminal cupin domain [Gammaproteobacteria bacterium]|nr:phosphomannose isomerase type II C-terminal cupin domain [Gammaproteobacteria bacterium]MBT4463014.1 phosphomannose isomerase type II C-terminal cupin domain [Gammaproteobacteria bacterium]MBT4654564.1 phosphomannose isomerase type II C-terminal cupin domain [Gammaproteobacteria bacterium]MBT5117102.1 phosphomannose isomerase type II C-terminal cupin domain [Gammaproteobacteria bacterium]MBT5761249.1 phosphomannose isomerase type II C-terminal cupin domain [Gammaproteobacteria bacterium]